MNKKRIYLVIAVVLLVVLIGIVSVGIPVLFPMLRKDTPKETVAIVDRGMVVIATEASGAVVAENEVIILSPSSSVIRKIHKEPGARVAAGDVILELDTEAVISEIESITDQLEMKRNSLEKTRLNNRSSMIDLDYNVEAKKLRITSLKSQLADEEQLLSVGGISPARLQETKQNITLAEKELAMVIEKNEIRIQQLKVDEEVLLLQIRIQEKQLEEKKKLLNDLKVKAPSDGIILEVSGKVGEKTNTDRMLVRMSDLTTFKIIGSIDEKYSDYIKTGNLVFAFLDHEKLEGRIGIIPPVIENSKIQFTVHLDQSDHPALIANQTIPLQVVQSLRNNTLRVPSSERFYPDHEQTVFVKDSERVVQRNVKFGMKGIEYQEILSGLNEGDRVVTSQGAGHHEEFTETSDQ
jgi:HlyD family secretion protein